MTTIDKVCCEACIGKLLEKTNGKPYCLNTSCTCHSTQEESTCTEGGETSWEVEEYTTLALLTDVFERKGLMGIKLHYLSLINSLLTSQKEQIRKEINKLTEQSEKYVLYQRIHYRSALNDVLRKIDNLD